MPRLHDGGHVLGDPGDRQWTARDEHNDNRCTGGVHCLQQLLLPTGQAQMGSGTRLTAHPGTLPKHHHGHICLVCSAHCLADLVDAIACNGTALDVAQRALLRPQDTQSVENRFYVLGPSLAVPAAQWCLSVVRQWPDQGDLAGRCQG